MDGTAADVRIILRRPGGPVGKLLDDAVPVVAYWINQWSDFAASALACPVTIVLVADGHEDDHPDQVSVALQVPAVEDADSARAAVLTGVLDGLVEASRRYPRRPTVEVRSEPEASSDGSDEFETFGPGEMAVFAFLGGDDALAGEAADSLGSDLERLLQGVALLQDTAVAGGYGQWILGRWEV